VATATKKVPDGFHAITPHVVVKGASSALDFYRRAFGAEEVMRCAGPDGKSIMHAEMQIGDSRFFICDEFPDMGCRGPASLGGTPVTLHLYVADTDAAFKKAVAAGATSLMPPADMFWGDRYSKVQDPFGHHWSIATHIEDVQPVELQKRAAAAFAGGGCAEKK